MTTLLTAIRYLRYVSNFSPVPAIALGWKKRGALWYYVCVCLLCDIVTLGLRDYEVIHYLASNFFIIVEFALTGLYLCEKIANRKQRMAIITPFVVFFILHTIIYAPYRVNFIGAAILYSLLIIACMINLFFVMREIEYVKIEHSPRFIFSAGFLIYASGSFFMFIYYIYFNEKYPVLLNKLWGLHNLLNIIKNLAIARFFVLTVKQSSIAGR